MEKKKYIGPIFGSIALILVLIFFGFSESSKDAQSKKKIFWLIPDGLRAEPDLFTIYQWAEEGLLPNIKKMMETGAYGYSIPTFPSHTPTNFATLFTGTYPSKHGVADGPMREEGNALASPSVGGFSSTAKWNEPIWKTFERQDYKVTLLSLPGSTPPEIQFGDVIRGRWGGWGADFHALNFQSYLGRAERVRRGRGTRLFFAGPQLTEFLRPMKRIPSWLSQFKSYSSLKVSQGKGWGFSFYIVVSDQTDDQNVNYDTVTFFDIEKKQLANVQYQKWSPWIPAKLIWSGRIISSNISFHVISLHPGDGKFKVRLLFDNLNPYIVQPNHLAQELREGVGPMIDFVDNFPPQLIYTEDDRQTFLSEANFSLDWHRKAAGYLIDERKPELFIQDTYTPNQMLTSRWWMGYIDPKGKRFGEVNRLTREARWEEVKKMYQGIDAILGEYLKRADENTYVVLSSDHGATPLNQWVRVNNWLAKKGWLRFTINKKTGEPYINWRRSKAIYLKMNHIFINPNGLDGKWKRASGPKYEKLRRKIQKELLALKDANNITPTEKVLPWEIASQELKLPKERIGDLVIVNRPGYGWNEEMTKSREVFDQPLKTGYKQAILPDNLKDMWTPFVIVGPDIKKGFALPNPIRHVDQYRTLFHLTGLKSKNRLDGRVALEAIEE